MPFQSCQAQNPVLGNPSGLVPLGLSTKMSTFEPETPKCEAALSASAARSDCAAAEGAAEASSTQVPASTEPPKVGELPLPSVYWLVTVDQVSPEAPSPPNRFCM